MAKFRKPSPIPLPGYRQQHMGFTTNYFSADELSLTRAKKVYKWLARFIAWKEQKNEH